LFSGSDLAYGYLAECGCGLFCSDFPRLDGNDHKLNWIELLNVIKQYYVNNTATMPVRKMPSKVPVPPMEAMGVPCLANILQP